MLFSSCGGDDGNEDDGGTTVPETTTTAPDTTAGTEGSAPELSGAEAEAEAAVLQTEDLPAGWEAKPDEESLDHETTWAALLACGGIAGPGEGLAANASSSTFQTGVGTQVTSALSYYDSAATVEALAEAFTADDFLACGEGALLDDVERNAPPGATFSDLVVAPLEFPELGETTVSYRINGMIDIGPVTIPLFQDFIAVFDGDAVSRLNFLNPGGPFPEDLQQTLVETVVGRA
ncbi:MAG: hypothetical protein ACR2K0_03810 [Acidimicrobiales bacterium]